MNPEESSDEDYDNIPLINIFDARVDNIVKETQEIKKKDLSELLKEKEAEKKEKSPFDIISPESIKFLHETLGKKAATGKKSKRGDKRKSDSPLRAEDVLKLSRKAKERIRILELETAHDARCFELQNKFVFDMLEEQDAKEKEKKVEVLPLSNRDMFLKVRYRSKIHRIQVKLREPFHYIFSKVADVIGLKVTDILLCLDDRNIKLHDTPESLDIKILDVIDCLPFKDEPKQGGYNMMLLKFQSNDFRRRTEFYVHKLEKFSEIKKQYAAKRELNIEDFTITFKFDDESIDLEDNPLDMEIESGYVIDVFVKNKDEPSTSLCDTKDTKKLPPPPISVIDLD